MSGTWDAIATTLVAERGDALNRYAYLLTGSADDAADLVQEALVRTFGRPRMSLTLPRAEAYVRRAILNLVIDRSRRDGRWRDVRHLVAEPDRADAPDRAVDDRIDVAARVRALSPRQAACVVLRYYDDLPVEQIARTLGISSGAVKRYLSDALRSLSAQFDAADGGTPTGGDHVRS
ncbi:SigE family RNA polymerase sigma factor [Agromyces larvae]|uniref:RNA polymerase sigma factor n=1 Tax=Agromyces larvae TaxID=2929802 RepID=A0ABY4BZB6_9MICO|nr:SigE family RNA polymerase sigma factor [Agromyces larvae]UOE44585.1 RNA polymerase sigma factor [Agromyces larvae]